MAKKHDYKAVRVLIETGNLAEFRDIFNHASRTAVAGDLGIYYAKFKQLIDHVDRFTLQDLYQLARLVGVEGSKMVQLAVDQVEKDRALKTGKGKK